ncbi:hypothetical protein HD806DRAFT_517344 [Xylariaceae sp. AK1471]|nr:hypothetical protein HD806DRAFT_517344 [Xylariaceae sp. AK1471]
MATPSIQSQTTASGHSHGEMDPSQPDPPVQPGMPFKRMYQVRDEVRQADTRVHQFQGRLAAAQETTDWAQVE